MKKEELRVQLTEEWLKKLGFVFYDLENFEEEDPHPYESYRLFLDERAIQFIHVDITPNDRFSIGLGDVDMTDQSQHFYIGEYKYVDQLQNLINALKGEE